MKTKYLYIIIALLLILLALSIFLYASTYSTISQNRLSRLSEKDKNSSFPNTGIEEVPIGDSVYLDVYDISTPQSPPVSSTPISILNLFPAEKVAYITIDDGPDPYSTPEYLQVLKDNGIKATFFMIGSKMEKHPDLVKRIYDEGHSIGNHSYSHNYSALYSNIESFTNEIEKAENIIFSITNTKPKIFRAPGGSSKMHYVEFFDKLDELGYRTFDWNASTADTDPTGATKKEVIDNIKRESKGVKTLIILMHDNSNRKVSVQALPEIIEFLKNKEYSFASLNEYSPNYLMKKKPHSSIDKKTVQDAVYSVPASNPQ